MKYLKSIIYSVFILFILLASVLTFLLTTTPGLYTSIKLANIFIPGKIHVQKISGRLINQFSFNELTYINDTLHIQLMQGVMRWQLPTPWHPQLTIENLTANNALIGSKNTTDFQQFQTLQLQATLNNNRWIIKRLTTNLANLRLTLQASGQLDAPYPLSATLQVDPPGLQGIIKLDGDLNLYHWQGHFNGSANGELHGTLKNGFELDTQANWHDAKWPINRSNILHSSHGNVTITGTLLDTVISAKTHIESPIQAEWQIHARIKNKQADAKSILQILEGPLKTTIAANATLYSAQKAKLAFTINPGTYQLPPGSPIPDIPFKGGKLLIDLTPEALQAKGVLTIDPHKIVNVTLRMPKFRLNEISKPHQNIDGKVNLNIDSLDFLQGVNKAIESPKGQLQFNLSAKGTLDHPLMKGELSLTNASLSLPKTGLTFSPIQAKLQSSNNHWQAQGSITSEGQALLIKGQGEFSPKVTGQLSIHGNNFPSMKTTEYMINLSPQLAIKFNSTSLNVSGNILVPTAQLKPLSFSNTVNLSEDMVFVNQETSPTIPFKMTTDVDIKMGQNVELDVKGLHGFLDGALRVKQAPNSPLKAIGSLTIRDGTYRAYGQDLIVEQGQLIFNSGLLDNPGLRIRAIRKFNNTPSNAAGSNSILDFNSASLDTLDVSDKTIVGIEVSGRLNAHKITLFSIPPNLSQADILSMLLLGKPASQASKSGGQLLMAAISSMNLDSGKKGMQLLTQLKQTLGVDFNVQNNTLYNQKTNQISDNTALVVTKSLSKRIYISYNIGLLQPDNNVLTLKYLLNKFFSIQVNTSDSGTGIDLLYTHSDIGEET